MRQTYKATENVIYLCKTNIRIEVLKTRIKGMWCRRMNHNFKYIMQDCITALFFYLQENCVYNVFKYFTNVFCLVLIIMTYISASWGNNCIFTQENMFKTSIISSVTLSILYIILCRFYINLIIKKIYTGHKKKVKIHFT